jgi:hypothetical protein
MKHDEINKRFSELAGICWHEWSTKEENFSLQHCAKCGKIKGYESDNPDYCAHPGLVLEVMIKRDDFIAFASYLDWGLLRDKEYITLAAISWMEEKEVNNTKLDPVIDKESSAYMDN